MVKSKGLRWLMSALTLETDECVLWPFSVQSNKYGDFRTKETGHLLAHVWICQEAHGPRPLGFDAAHGCVTRLCCNKRHLSWKTRGDNLDDRREHGTMLQGESDPKAILTEAAVLSIRAAPRDRGVAAAMARELGCHPNTVYAVREGRSWKHLL